MSCFDMAKFPQIMGILNVTLDSFSDGGKYIDVDSAVEHASQMIEDGADIIDIGGESTRPGALAVEVNEEIGRVIPVVEKIKKLYPNAQISVDTCKYEVAEASVKLGVEFINDVSGLKSSPEIASLCADNNCGLIIMHMQGEPRTMQKSPVYNDVVEEVFSALQQKIEFARSMGVKRIIADVGIGFGKTYEHNITLLKNLERFDDLGVEMLLGISRKSFIGIGTGIELPQNRDIATMLIHSKLHRFGGDIIRIHNVKLAVQFKKSFEMMS